MSYWLFKPEVWLLLGIGLIILEVAVGLAFFVLPVGIAALIVSGAVYMEQNFWFADQIVLESWLEVTLLFAVLSVALVFVIRKVFKTGTEETPDINEY